MRSFSVLAVLSAVLSAGAAQACCFFKCCSKGSPANAARMQPMSVPGYGTGLTITYVAGQQVQNNQVANAVDSTHAFDVVVEQDYFLGLVSSPELTVTDEGPHNAPPRAAGAPAPAPKAARPPYKHKDKKLKWKKVVIGAAAAPAAGAAAAPDPIEFWLPYYEVTYSIPTADLATGRNYSVYASGGGAQSDTVSFYTAP
jgi:hypothetical protein